MRLLILIQTLFLMTCDICPAQDLLWIGGNDELTSSSEATAESDEPEDCRPATWDDVKRVYYIEVSWGRYDPKVELSKSDVGYRLYYTTESGLYSIDDRVEVGRPNSVRIENVLPGMYFFTLKSYRIGNQKNESPGFSDEVCAYFPSPIQIMGQQAFPKRYNSVNAAIKEGAMRANKDLNKEAN